jgi:spore coat polysaccharide biosynthesis protein SpsF (cytidylyltransferase family)/aryl-alcohol dehydrogenase-like predicted oxidoreductase
MKTVVVLQSRTTSSRLPRKALLSLAGYPISVLAALRAGNRGLETIVATSDDPSDDELVAILQGYNIPTFRGPLDDVLGRYHLASADLGEEATIVRITGDNVLPDGDFVQELVAAFVASGLEYLATESLKGGLPYGLAAEAFTVGALRRAHGAATARYDREHVGPWMMRNCRSATYTPKILGGADYSHLRCTIDDEEDYQRIVRLFQSVDSPVSVSWVELMYGLAALPGAPAFRVPFRIVSGRLQSECTLGTAQLGMDYGLVNRTGKPSRPDAVGLVRHAISHGVMHLDTARAYGDSEAVLGAALSGAWRSRVEIVTKLDTLDGLPSDEKTPVVRAAVDESVASSCRELNATRLPTLLLHRWHHRTAWQGAAWQRLLELQSEGIIRSLGASVSHPYEALEALQDPSVQHLQLPMNVLDRRWRASGVDKAVAARADLILHARSPFLQGILLHPPEAWPATDYDGEGCVRELHRLVRRFERQSIADLCLTYLRSQSWISSIVVGCETLAQLQHNLNLFRGPKLTTEQSEEVERALPVAPDDLLNPAKWKVPHEQPAVQ